MSKRTMRKKLARAYDLSPKEARLILRRCGYDYELAVYMLMLDRAPKDMTKAFEKLGKVAVEAGEALYDAFSRIGAAFLEAIGETANAVSDVISEVLDI